MFVEGSVLVITLTSDEALVSDEVSIDVSMPDATSVNETGGCFGVETMKKHPKTELFMNLNM